MKKDLPIWMISGSKDPLSKGGKTVRHLARLYDKLAGNKVEVLLLSGARHEVLNEKNKEELFVAISERLLQH